MDFLLSILPKDFHLECFPGSPRTYNVAVNIFTCLLAHRCKSASSLRTEIKNKTGLLNKDKGPPLCCFDILCSSVLTLYTSFALTGSIVSCMEVVFQSKCTSFYFTSHTSSESQTLQRLRNYSLFHPPTYKQLLSPINRWANWGQGMFSILPEVTQTSKKPGTKSSFPQDVHLQVLPTCLRQELHLGPWVKYFVKGFTSPHV